MVIMRPMWVVSLVVTLIFFLKSAFVSQSLLVVEPDFIGFLGLFFF